jgi:hypothetical protein
MSDRNYIEGRAYYVEEGRGNMPYLIYFQSKGGWPVFEAVPSWSEAVAVRDNFKDRGVAVQIYHWIQFDESRDDVDVPEEAKAKTAPDLGMGVVIVDPKKE